MTVNQWSAFGSLCFVCGAISAMWQYTQCMERPRRMFRRRSCYDGPDVTASRLEHGCIPTPYGLDFAPVASEDIMRDFSGEKAPADYDG